MKAFSGSAMIVSGIVMLASLASCASDAPPAPPPGAIPAGQKLGTSSIAGRAVFQGQIPPVEVINMSSDSACQASGAGTAREDVIVGPEGGGLKNVFVHVSSGLGERVFAPPEAPVVLDQRGCTYRPRVFGVQVNQVLEIVNSDPTLHNIHSMPSGNQPFNVGMPSQGMRIRKYFSNPEVMVRLKCDLHNWMAAWIGVVTHPFFAVSDGDGAFSIQDLPAGEYDVEAWHEVFGVRRQHVAVGDGDRKEISFDFSP